MAPFSKKEIGNKYESKAEKFLCDQGCSIVGKNFSTKFGEIDLIAQDGEQLVFVEVKYRKMDDFGHAAEFVTRQKSRRLIKTAYIWLDRHKLSPESASYRFDVIAIHAQGKDINWIKNAITQDY